MGLFDKKEERRKKKEEEPPKKKVRYFCTPLFPDEATRRMAYGKNYDEGTSASASKETKNHEPDGR